MKLIKNLSKLSVLGVLLGVLASCGFYTVPPTTKGKILSTSGYQPEVLTAGKYTLWGRDVMVLLDTSTKVYSEPVQVKLADKLTLQVDVKFAGRLSSNPKIVNTMFNDIVAGSDMSIAFQEVYAVYGRMVVRNKTREVISAYTVDDVHVNYKRISQEVGIAIEEALASTPIEISDIMIGNIEYPRVVVQAIENNEERRLAIEKEQAQAAIDMTKKENELLLAKAQYQIEMTRAKAIRDKNVIIGEGITPDLLKLRALEVQEEMAKNKSAVFIPYEAIGSVGVQNRIYSKKE